MSALLVVFMLSFLLSVWFQAAIVAARCLEKVICASDKFAALVSTILRRMKVGGLGGSSIFMEPAYAQSPLANMKAKIFLKPVAPVGPPEDRLEARRISSSSLKVTTVRIRAAGGLLAFVLKFRPPE